VKSAERCSLLWKVRCGAAWLCRGLGVVVASYLILVLMRVYDADPSTFLQMFPYGLAEVAIVGFGAFGVLDLLGRLISWTNPKGPMPRFRDRVK
jgi:hypothetical protein